MQSQEKVEELKIAPNQHKVCVVLLFVQRQLFSPHTIFVNFFSSFAVVIRAVLLVQFYAGEAAKAAQT